MTVASREQIGKILSEIGTPRIFSARRTQPVDDLHLEVKGLGRLSFPVSRRQAQQLCQIARPARYGQGEQTLLDRRVRDTWKIPKSRVKIDQRRWKRTLLPVLEQLRADLGVPAGCRLTAELHAMLVYAPGQFFLPHQDSEKAPCTCQPIHKSPVFNDLAAAEASGSLPRAKKVALKGRIAVRFAAVFPSYL